MTPVADLPTRAAALRRIAAEVSEHPDLDGLFRDVIDEALTLFGVDQAGLWTYHDGPVSLRLVAQRGLSPEILEIVARLPREPRSAGMDALREREVRVVGGKLETTVPKVRAAYRRAGIHTICFVPIVFRDAGPRPAGPVSPDRARLDTRRDRARAGVRGPHGDGDRQRAAGRHDPLDGRPVAGDRRAGRPAEPPPGRRGHRPRDRGRGRDPPRPRHDPRLSGRPRDRDVRADRLPRDVHGRRRPGPVDAPGRDRDRSHGLGGGARGDGPAWRRGGRPADPHRPLDGRSGVDADRADDLRRDGPWRHRRVQGRARPLRRRRRDDPRDLRRICRPGTRQRFQHRAASPPAERARAPARGPAPAARGQRAAPVDARAGRRPRADRGCAAGDRPVRLVEHLPDRPDRQHPPCGRRPRPVRRADPRPRDAARDRADRLGHRPWRSRPRQSSPPRPTLHPGTRHAVRAGGDDRRPALRRGRADRHAQHRPDGRFRGGLQRERVRADPALRGAGVDRAAERRGPRCRPGPRRPRCPDRSTQPWLVPARARGGGRGRRAGGAVRHPDARPRRVQGLQRRVRPSGRRCLPRRGRRRHPRCDAPGRPRLPLRRGRVRGDPARGGPGRSPTTSRSGSAGPSPTCPARPAGRA